MTSDTMSENAYTVSHSLDLRGVACPMNFVKTKLFLDKLASGTILEVLLDPGEPVESVTSSVEAEGHIVHLNVLVIGGYYRVHICKS